MAGWHLDTKMAQDIVARTMRIIDTNINVMDARGRIIGSGDRERIGELHEGRCWCSLRGAWSTSMTPWRNICTGFVRDQPAAASGRRDCWRYRSDRRS